MRWLLTTAVLLITGCGAADIGEECEAPGTSADCINGAVCTADGASEEAGVCRSLCASDSECGEGETCVTASGAAQARCEPDATVQAREGDTAHGAKKRHGKKHGDDCDCHGSDDDSDD